MHRPDKYPFLNPCEPFIFARIIATAQEMRKIQRSHPYIEKLKKEERERGDRQRMNQQQKKKKAEEAWLRALPMSIPKL